MNDLLYNPIFHHKNVWQCSNHAREMHNEMLFEKEGEQNSKGIHMKVIFLRLQENKKIILDGSVLSSEKRRDYFLPKENTHVHQELAQEFLHF